MFFVLKRLVSLNIFQVEDKNKYFRNSYLVIPNSRLLFNSINVYYISIIFILFGVISNLKAAEKIDSTKVYNLPSITVTTTKAIEGESPVPFSEITRAKIENLYIFKDMPDLISELPSAYSYSENGNSVGYSDLSIRGFDQRRVSVMINGIPQNDPEDHGVYWIDFPDLTSNLANIQVQRGAGLANYGGAAIGGSINLTTSNFANEKGVNVFIGQGWQQYSDTSRKKNTPNLNKYSVEFSSGLNGNYAFYGRLSSINSEGYRTQSSALLQSYFFSAARFDENLTTQINLFGGPIADALAYTGLPKSYIKNSELRLSNPSDWAYDSTGKEISWFSPRRPQELEQFSQPHIEMLNDLYISKNVTIKSALFYYTGDGYFDYDASWADATLAAWVNPDYNFNNGQTFKNTLVRGWVGSKQGGWIPRIVWTQDFGELDAGAEMRFNRSDHWGKIVFSEFYPAGYDTDYKIYSYNGARDILSAFARERLDLSKQFSLTLEGQLVRQRFSIYNEKHGDRYATYVNFNSDTISGKGNVFDVHFLFFNPRIGANYIINDNSNIYSMLAYTSREPRMQNLYDGENSYWDPAAKPLFESKIMPDSSIAYNFSQPLIKPEKMLDFELGYNYQTQDLNFGIDVYWMEYYDELVNSGMVDIFGNPIDGNAPRTRHYGLEIQFSDVIFNSSNSGKIEIGANACISKNYIINFDYASGNGVNISLKNNPIAGFPNALTNIRLSYLYDNLFISLLGKYVGDIRTDNFGDMLTTNAALIQSLQNTDYGYYADNTVNSYFVANFDMSYTFKNVWNLRGIKLQAQVNNLLNKLYAAGGVGKYFFPAAERNIFLGVEVQY